jgi:hypothetical protein
MRFTTASFSSGAYVQVEATDAHGGPAEEHGRQPRARCGETRLDAFTDGEPMRHRFVWPEADNAALLTRAAKKGAQQVAHGRVPDVFLRIGREVDEAGALTFVAHRATLNHQRQRRPDRRIAGRVGELGPHLGGGRPPAAMQDGHDLPLAAAEPGVRIHSAKAVQGTRDRNMRKNPHIGKLVCWARVRQGCGAAGPHPGTIR